MELWQERNKNVRPDSLLTFVGLTWSTKLEALTIFLNAHAKKAKLCDKVPDKLHWPLHAISMTMRQLQSCQDANIWFMPCILYSSKTVALFPSVVKMMNIILHIPLLISHVFIYQASGYIIIYIAGDWTKKTLNDLQGNQNTFGPNQSEMLIFPIWTICKIFTVCDYAGFSHAKFLPWDLWACLHLYVKSSSDHDNSQLKNNLAVWYGKNGKPKPLLNGFKALKARPKRIIWIFAVIPFVDTDFYVACCSVDGMAAWF